MKAKYSFISSLSIYFEISVSKEINTNNVDLVFLKSKNEFIFTIVN